MYESHFGFTAKPFQLNPDPDFFFGSRGHKRALAYLEYGLHQGEGFIVITGEVGAGKTTLVRGLLQRIHQESVIPAQIVSTQVGSDDLLRMVASAFGLKNEDENKATLLVRLEQYFESLYTTGKRALLIVDEAQNLSTHAVEELRMLSNFQVGSHSLIQSFLVGQPEFRSIMQYPEMRQLKQRVIASYHLGPLDEQETEQYIEHRLKHVGWHKNPTFEADAFKQIFTTTSGVPRKINTLCDRLLLSAFLSEKTHISADDTQAVANELSGELDDTSNQIPINKSKIEYNNQRSENPDESGPQHIQNLPTRHDNPTTRENNNRLTELIERIEILEASNNIILSLLKKITRSLANKQREL